MNTLAAPKNLDEANLWDERKEEKKITDQIDKADQKRKEEAEKAEKGKSK